MNNLPIRIAALILSIGVPTVLAFNNCSGDIAANEGLSSQSSSNCTLAAAGFRSPDTIDETMALINNLPKPLTLDCFLQNITRPLNIFAVDNAFSAQPSAGPSSPRIFIIRSNFVLSIVPAGNGKNLLEMGQFVSSSESVKGELQFPVNATLPATAPYDRIVSPVSGTTCKNCHLGERQAFGDFAGTAFANGVMQPDPFKRIPSSSLANFARNCDSNNDAYRCNILKSIFVIGQGRDAAFPQ